LFVAVSMNDTELEAIETTASVRLSGEDPIPCTSTCPKYSGLKLPGWGSPKRIVPRSRFVADSVTETVFENCSAE
jgi:hypothetical protein